MVPYRSDEAFGLDILCGSVMVMIRVIVGFGVSTQRIVILLKCNGKKRLNTGAMEAFLSRVDSARAIDGMEKKCEGSVITSFEVSSCTS